jgi:D-hexose-6-phosphate mutarotase
MKEFGMEKNPQLKIETVKTPEGNEVSFCPERGGIITSIKFDGNEVLYMDDETFNNKEVNVKGGVPILFPNAGPIPDEIKTDELGGNYLFKKKTCIKKFKTAWFC